MYKHSFVFQNDFQKFFIEIDNEIIHQVKTTYFYEHFLCFMT